MNVPMEVTWVHLAISSLLLIIPGVVSLFLRLKLFAPLMIAGIRSVLQLCFIGYVLVYVFQLNNLWCILLLVTFMCFMAMHTASKRVGHVKIPLFGTEFLSIWISTFLVGFIVVAGILRPSPWYQASIFIPLCGMILGNSMNGITLCLDRFYSEVSNRRDKIETLLSFGATPWEAIRDPFKEALRAGMTPILNAMTIAGIVSLPGMMTGQILAGADPLVAVRYQIVVLFMIAAAVAIGSLLSLGSVCRRIITKEGFLTLPS